MKQGCTIILLVMGLVGWWYSTILVGTPLSDYYWLPLIFAIGAGIVISNFYGILIAFKQSAACKRPRTLWRDGDLVGVSGNIQSNRSPIITPISKQSAVIAEYTIRKYSSDKNQSAVASYSGFLMTPCSIQGNQGVARIIGFPILTTGEIRYSDPEHYKNAAQYLRTTQFETQSRSMSGAIAELNKVLTDDDGDVKSDFMVNGETVHEDDACEARLVAERYQLCETVVPNGAVVTVFGTFNSTKQAIHIGSGIRNLSHSIHLGSASEVCSRNIIKACAFTAFFTTAFTWGNIYFFDQLGIDIVEKGKNYLNELLAES